MARFRVLHGVHSEGGKIYKTGKVVDSASDLSKHNSPGAQKFLKISDSDPQVQTPVDELNLESMKIEELRSYAEQEGIEIPSEVTRKSDIIEVIEESLTE